MFQCVNMPLSQCCHPQSLQSTHRCRPMFRPHIRLVGRHIQRQTRGRRLQFSVTALQPRVPLEMPEGTLYRSSLLTYKVGELRDELTRRKADNRGIKKLLVERLFNIMQEESRKLASAKQFAATDSFPAVPTRAPRRSRRSTDSSAGLQLRRTSQQHDQESSASQIMQSMQSMPAPHARQAAFAVRRTLISKLGMAAKASAAKQQQEQLVAADAVSRSAASAWPPQEQSSGHSSNQTLPRASMQSAEARHASSQLSAAAVDQLAADRRLKAQPTAVQSSEAETTPDQGHHTHDHTPKELAQQAQQAQHPEHAEVAQRTQQAQHLQRAEEAQRAQQAQVPQQAQHAPQTGLAIENPLSAGTSHSLPAGTPHTVSPSTSDPTSTSISGSTADSAQRQHPLQSPGSTATQAQPSRHSATGQAIQESLTVPSATSTLPPHTSPHMLSQAEEEDWWEDTEGAAGVDSSAQQRQTSSAQAGNNLASRNQASSTEQSLAENGQAWSEQASSTHPRQASNGEASTSYDAGTAWKDTRDVEALNSNVTGLQISFLGTAGRQDCRTRSPNCIAVRAQKAVILFDCGEDAQRQLMQQPQLGHGKINRIFVTSNSSENIFGLPGMLCTLSWARERGFEDADIPIHVYGPPGLAEYVRSILLLSDTYSMVPILIHEFSTTACDPQPEKILERGRLYKVRLPPDQLNPEGYYDGTLKKAFLARFSRKKKSGRADLRAPTKKMRLPEPGDPDRTGISIADMSWTTSCDEDFAVTAYSLPHTQPCWGYCLQEADRPGNLDVVKAQQLGIPPGRAYGELKAGESVLNTDGEVVLPQQVVGPDQLGRKIAILGEASNLQAAAQWALRAHTVVAAVPAHTHSVTAATGMAALADAVGAQQLILTHLDDDDIRTESVVRQAAGACTAVVHAAYDHLVSVLDKLKT